MELIHRNSWSKDEYYCQITEKLDEISGVADKTYHFKNYLLDTRDIWGNTFSIRKPGRTTGVVRLDENNVIIECCVSNELYPENTNKILEKFIGQTLNVDSLK